MSLWRTGLLLFSPLLLVLAGAFIVPLILLAPTSFNEYQPGTGIVAGSFTLQNYVRIVADEYYREVVLRTLSLGVGVTIACLLFGYPVAYLIEFRPALPLAAQAEGDVLMGCEMREQRVGLEDQPDIALVGRQPGDVPVADADRAAARLDQPGHHAQYRRLAAARRSEQRDEFALVDRERYVLHDGPATVALDHMVQGKLAHRVQTEA